MWKEVIVILEWSGREAVGCNRVTCVILNSFLIPRFCPFLMLEVVDCPSGRGYYFNIMINLFTRRLYLWLWEVSTGWSCLELEQGKVTGDTIVKATIYWTFRSLLVFMLHVLFSYFIFTTLWGDIINALHMRKIHHRESTPPKVTELV